MSFIIADHYLEKFNVYKSFQSFLVHDGTLTLASSIVIGLATATFIKCLVIDLILPIIYIAFFGWLQFVSKSASDKTKEIYGHSQFQIVHIFQELIIWIFAVIATFAILEYFVRKFVVRKVTEESKKH